MSNVVKIKKNTKGYEYDILSDSMRPIKRKSPARVIKLK